MAIDRTSLHGSLLEMRNQTLVWARWITLVLANPTMSSSNILPAAPLGLHVSHRSSLGLEKMHVEHAQSEPFPHAARREEGCLSELKIVTMLY